MISTNKQLLKQQSGKKKIQVRTRFELVTSAIPVQRSNQLTYQSNWELDICK